MAECHSADEGAILGAVSDEIEGVGFLKVGEVAAAGVGTDAAGAGASTGDSTGEAAGDGLEEDKEGNDGEGEAHGEKNKSGSEDLVDALDGAGKADSANSIVVKNVVNGAPG